MLAFGWTIERTKEGDAFGMHTCTRRVSQSGQVCVLRRLHLLSHWAPNMSDIVKVISLTTKVLPYWILHAFLVE